MLQFQVNQHVRLIEYHLLLVIYGDYVVIYIHELCEFGLYHPIYMFYIQNPSKTHPKTLQNLPKTLLDTFNDVKRILIIPKHCISIKNEFKIRLKKKNLN